MKMKIFLENHHAKQEALIQILIQSLLNCTFYKQN
jgi:hypothetical protein